MRKTVVSLSVSVAVVFAWSALTSFAQAPQAAKPGPEHKRLEHFVGKWTAEGKIEPSPMGPGGKFTTSETCEWFEGGYAVVCRAEGTGPMGASKSIGIISYSPEEKVYTYYGVENSPMAMTSVPKGTVQGDTWTFTDESMMGAQKFKYRVTIKELSPSEHTFTMEMQTPDGKWVPAMESKATKTKS
jgi:Protein of unknown function (DUF1579)